MYKIMLYDEYRDKYAELTDQSDQKLISDFTFELLDTGCGAFSINFAELPDYKIERNDVVEIYLMDDTTAWFTGIIQSIPENGRTDNSFVFNGYGLIAQLNDVVTNKNYTATEVSAIIYDLLNTYAFPFTDIKYNSAKITASAVTTNESNFDYTKVKKAIYDLSAQASDYVAGVDEVGEFFFVPRSTAVQQAAVKAVEYHLDNFTPKEDMSKIANKLYVKCAAVTSGSNYIGYVEDLTSQADYGLKEDVITIPTTTDATDALNFANDVLAKMAEPKITANVSNINITLLGEKINAIGMARILLRKE